MTAAGRPPVAHAVRVQQDQLARALHRQRVEQQRVDDAEDGGVRADAERERQHHHCREAGERDEPTARVTNVLPEIGEHDPPASFLTCVVVQALRPPIDVRSNVRSIGIPEGGCEVCPVGDLRARVGIGVGLRHAARDRLAIEVFELRRQLPHDARFALARELRQ